MVEDKPVNPNMKYVLQRTNNPKNYRGATGVPKLFDSEADARLYVSRNALTPGYWRIVEMDGASWKQEMRTRIVRTANVYQDTEILLPVWFEESWYEWMNGPQFAHVTGDKENKQFITYFPDDIKGSKGQTSIIKPGKFLQQFYGNVLNEAEIKHWADRHREQFSNGPDLKWAETPDEIEAVYSRRAGFTSCMQYAAGHWSDGIHPTRAYGAGDLAVAYIERGTSLLARALVWREKKKVGRIYGDVPLLRKALREVGIITDSSNDYYDTFQGAKMLYIPVPGRKRRECDGPPAILPYIDGRSYCGLIPVEGHPELLQICESNKGKFAAVTQDAIHHPSNTCARCGKYGARNDIVMVEGADANNYSSDNLKKWVCNDCMQDRKKTFLCNYTGVYFSTKHYTPVSLYDSYGNSSIACKEIVSSNVRESQRTPGRLYRIQHIVLVEGAAWGIDEARAHAVQNTFNNQWYRRGSLTSFGQHRGTKVQIANLMRNINELFPRVIT